MDRYELADMLTKKILTPEKTIEEVPTLTTTELVSWLRAPDGELSDIKMKAAVTEAERRINQNFKGL